MIHEKERDEERTEDALASRDDEGRGKLRKVAGICKQELIREYPNGATHWIEDPVPSNWWGEPGELKHLYSSSFSPSSYISLIDTGIPHAEILTVILEILGQSRNISS